MEWCIPNFAFQNYNFQSITVSIRKPVSGFEHVGYDRVSQVITITPLLSRIQQRRPRVNPMPISRVEDILFLWQSRSYLRMFMIRFRLRVLVGRLACLWHWIGIRKASCLNGKVSCRDGEVPLSYTL